MDRTLFALCALLFNAAFGGPREWYASLGLTRIALLPARGLRHFERKLNRDHRSSSEREMRGWVLLLALIAASVVMGLAGGWFLQRNFHFLELVLVAVLLPVRPIWDRIDSIRNSLIQNNVAKAREAFSGTVWRHHALLDEFGLARASIEITAVDFSEKIVCPLLGYIFLGLPGLLVCRSVTLARDVLSNTPDFAKGTRLAHGVLQYIPSRLSALLWMMTPFFLPSGRVDDAARRIAPGLVADAPRQLNLRAASVVGKVALGGPSSPYVPGLWLENGTLKPNRADVRRVQAAFVFLTIFLFVFVGVFF